MPLQSTDRKFLQTIDRFKAYLLFMAGAVLMFLLLTPSDEIRVSTAVIGTALCGLFWLTQRLLGYITLLDVELMRVVDALKRTLPEEERRRLERGGK